MATTLTLMRAGVGFHFVAPNLLFAQAFYRTIKADPKGKLSGLMGLVLGKSAIATRSREHFYDYFSLD